MSAAQADHVGAIAVGTLAAQRFIDAIRRDQAVSAEVIEEIQQLQIEHGVDSPAISAFLVEITKRASR